MINDCGGMDNSHEERIHTGREPQASLAPKVRKEEAGFVKYGRVKSISKDQKVTKRKGKRGSGKVGSRKSRDLTAKVGAMSPVFGPIGSRW